MNNYDNFAFLITCFEQVNLTKENLERIRFQYKKLNNCKVCIVSTSENIDIINQFIELEQKYSNVKFISYINAPGNTKSEFKFPEQEYINWRHKHIPPRIFISISKGLNYLYDIGIEKVLHIHSDSYYEPGYGEENLVKDIDLVQNYCCLADLSIHEENANKAMKLLPSNLAWHPENILFNLNKCKDNGFGFTFEQMFNNPEFKPTNWGSPEVLLGQYFKYCLVNGNTRSYDDELGYEYNRNVLFRQTRDYHGKWNGFVNLHGQQ